jgi:imidazolonepropionase-like amidohydrolase
VNAHARSNLSVQNCVKAGVDGIFHAEFVDEETLDMLEAAKDRLFVMPTVSLFPIMMNEASAFGFTPEVGTMMGLPAVIEASAKTHTELRKRGVRHLIGGDYGFAWSRQGTNARDLKFFVDLFGYTPEGALQCATRNGGLAMRDEGDLGMIREGALADMLLVNGDPLADVSIMTDKDRLVMIMKDGQVHKNETAAVQRRAAA